MRILRLLVGIVALARSVCSSPAGALKAREAPGFGAVYTQPTDRQEANTLSPSQATTPGSTNLSIVPATHGAVFTTRSTEHSQWSTIKSDFNGAASAQVNQPTPPVVPDDGPSTTTTIEVAVATVRVIATETVAVGASPAPSTISSSGDSIAPAAVGSDQPIRVNSTTITPENSNPSDSSIVPILGSNDTTPYTGSNSSIVAILDGDDTNDKENDYLGSTAAVPVADNVSNPIIIGKMQKKRQLAADNMANSDSITFQAHAGEGFVQPQVVPVFQQVVDTTTTDTTTTFSSTTTEDVSTTLTSGTTAITTTSWTSETGTTTSTTTTWQTQTSVSPGVAIVTEWTTASRTTCIPPESHTSAPALIPATCTDTTTLCTITLAYVVSMDATTTSYYTTDLDMVNTAATTATQTMYSDDPNGFHVYITTQNNPNGDATATYYFTTPSPTALPQQVNVAGPTIPDRAVLYTGLVLLWSFVLIALV